MKELIQTVFFIVIMGTSQIGCNASIMPVEPIPAAEQPEKYIKLLNNKNVALMVNHTSMVDSIHLVDFLLDKGINLIKIFAVEHGFRGKAANGEEISSTKDKKTGLPIVSLYGNKKKPSAADLNEVDIVVFDMQDVGCRFYTYISSMHYLMEACAGNNVQVLILDRPNPNGDYVAGPVLDTELKSFVGMHPIPVIHGCTVGELAQMIIGEGWLSTQKPCEIEVIPVKHYTHKTRYEPPIKPSPNLPNYQSIRLYPSLCFFEATNVSIGRGTDFPFQVIGFPGGNGDFTFIPRNIPGVSNNPLHENKTCTGTDLRKVKSVPGFTLKYFIDFHKQFEDTDDFWKSKRWIELLSGRKEFYRQINSGLSEKEIRASWQKELNQYKTTRKKYLLYPDFE
ncbi:MAG TPA: DUF1343 domain-containing protein [Prolixibacteraceae bacterium]|nr:DUF1343 domain-containing protein [Prolixibacteraceae bacterium]